jgi:hypothetical protein
MSHIS